MAKNKTPSVDQIFSELETIIKQLEENLPLEESLVRFEDGIRLVRTAQQRLQEAEQKVQLLLEKNNLPEAAPFQMDDEDKDPQ